MPAQTYTVELSDGRKVPMQFDHPPTQAEVMAELSKASAPTSKAPQARRDPVMDSLGAWKGLFSREALKSLVSLPSKPELLRDLKQSAQYGEGELKGFLQALPPVALFQLAKTIHQEGIQKTAKDLPANLWQTVADAIDLKPEVVGAALGAIAGTPATGKVMEGAGNAIVRNPGMQAATDIAVGGAAGMTLMPAIGLGGPLVGGMIGRQFGKAVGMGEGIGKGLRYMGRAMQKATPGLAMDTPESVATGDELAATGVTADKAADAAQKARIGQIRLEHPSWSVQAIADEAKRQLQAETEQDAKITAMANKAMAKARPAPAAMASPVTPAEAAVEGRSVAPPKPPPEGPADAFTVVAKKQNMAQPLPGAEPPPVTPGGLRLVGKTQLDLQEQVAKTIYRAQAKDVFAEHPDWDPIQVDEEVVKRINAGKAKKAAAAADGKAEGVGIARQPPKLVLSPEEAAAEEQLKKAYRPSAELQGMKSAARVPLSSEDVPYDPSSEK